MQKLIESLNCFLFKFFLIFLRSYCASAIIYLGLMFLVIFVTQKQQTFSFVSKLGLD